MPEFDCVILTIGSSEAMKKFESFDVIHSLFREMYDSRRNGQKMYFLLFRGTNAVAYSNLVAYGPELVPENYAKFETID